ncbi:tetratricopeptide repeat protein [Rubripirellula amarantea]|nr:tetratricopeptide repeat protein [Rubripirellula amarantea]
MSPLPLNLHRLILLGAAHCLLSVGWACASDSALSQIEQAVAAGQLDSLSDQIQGIDWSETTPDRAIKTLVRTARAFEQAGNLDMAAKLYQEAGKQTHRGDTQTPQDGTTSRFANQRTVIQLALISVATRQNDHVQVISSLEELAANPHLIAAPQRQALLSLAFSMGASSLNEQNFDSAADAYRAAEALADEEQKATALLGQAWTTVLRATEPLQAAQQLGSFVERYPDHPDAAQATRVCAKCLTEVGRVDDAQRMLSDLLMRWPDSVPAKELVESHVGLGFDEIPESVRGWLIGQCEHSASLDWSATLMGLSIRVACQVGQADKAQLMAEKLARQDLSGQATTDLLDQLDDKDAEWLASMYVSPAPQLQVTSKVREAACRWAGRNEKWSMLAMAAQSESIDRATSGRSVAVERLFAESLMQTGKTSEAREWWSHIVDTRNASDFATLLRCAEAETATGNDTSLAESRISLARQSCGDNEFAVTLVDLLAAELAIRRSRFDEARSLLENVIRGVGIDRHLRGRAQWLIGETFYLQNKFTDAINAYRSVEGVDPDGPWVAAALVQAGKSFEQLGRTREATVCYGTLLGRFADSPYSDAARKRMAAISPASTRDLSPPIRR